MKRRDFLRTLAAASGTLLASARAAEPFRPRYMLASALYGDLPLATILPEVKKTGATSIDLWPKKHGTQREEIDMIGHEKFAAMLKEHGLTLGGTTRFDLGPFKQAEEIDVVQKLGGSIIVTGAAGSYKLTGDALKEEVRGFAEKLKPTGVKAQAQGVTVAIENHVNSLIDTPDSLRWFAEFAPPGIGIALAPYHLPQETALLAELIEKCGPKLTLFYAWQYGMGCMKPMPKEEEIQQLPGRGKLDFKPLFAALGQIGFTGPTEIFMHPTPRGIPILPTAEQVTAEINHSRSYLDALVG
jgi:sugar phosphate isomerase/epimerase